MRSAFTTPHRPPPPQLLSPSTIQLVEVKSKMKFLSTTLAVALTSLVSSSQALYFYLDGTQPKCFYEDLPKGTLVVGTFPTNRSSRLRRWSLYSLKPLQAPHPPPLLPRTPSNCAYRNIPRRSLLPAIPILPRHPRPLHPLHRRRDLRQRPPRRHPNYAILDLPLKVHLQRRRLGSPPIMLHAQRSRRHQREWLV